MMRRYGFHHYSAVIDFLKGKSLIEDKCDREVAKLNGQDPVKLFERVIQLDPDNPYGYAYLLFAMEDSGCYTIKQMADVSAKWHDAAIAYRYQGQNALAMAYLTKYVKLETEVSDGESLPEYSA